jgi:FkbM family methyltransferase
MTHKDYKIGNRKDIIKNILKYENKYTFRIDAKDIIIQDYLKKGYMYGIKILILLNSYIKPDDVILDVGANIGIISIPTSKMAYKGKVHAFEPFKQNCEYLTWNAKKNKSANIKIHNYAIGHKIGSTTLSDQVINENNEYVSEKSLKKTDKVNYGHIRLGKKGQKVKIKTIDSMKFDKVDIMKVDVEGAEPLVFYGAKKTIKKFMPIIVFERNEYGVSKDMIEEMKLKPSVYKFDILKYAISLGYITLINIFPDDYVLIPPNRDVIFNDPMLNLKPMKRINGITINTKNIKLKYFAKLDWSLLK